MAFAAAFLTKQTALLIVLPVLLHYILFNRRRVVAFAAPLAVIVPGSTYLLDHLNHGWYSYYVFYLPGRHPLEPRMIRDTFTSDLRPLLIALAVAFYGLGADLAAPDRRDRGRFYLLAAAGLLGGAWASRIHRGGYKNVLMPACAAAAILFGLGLHAALSRAQAGRARAAVVGALYVAGLLQFAVLAYDPRALIPRPEDAAAGRNFVEAMRQIPGRVFVPSHGYLAVLAGKESGAHTMAVADVVRGDDGPARAEMTRRFSEMIARRDFSAIVIDEKWFIREELERAYVRSGSVFRGPRVFWPVTGMKTRPESIYLPRPSSP